MPTGVLEDNCFPKNFCNYGLSAKAFTYLILDITVLSVYLRKAKNTQNMTP